MVWSEQKAMPQAFDWADYLSFAQNLNPLDGEATIRAAISRAYYAAYGRACTRLKRRRVIFPQRDLHTFVWNQYVNFPNADGDDIGDNGFTLKQRRVRADYHDAPPLKATDMQIALRDAATLIRDIDDLLRRGI